MQVFEITGQNALEVVSQEFTESQQHQIDKEYKTALPKKAKKIKIYTMKIVDMFKQGERWYITAEQHHYYEYEGHQMDEPLNTSMFILKDQKLRTSLQWKKVNV